MKNKKFTLYDAATGMVLSSGECAYPHLIEEPGVAVLIGEAYSSGWIEYGEHFSLPERPSPYHVFDYSIKQWVDPRTPDTEWGLVRRERNRRLVATDWTQLPDVPLATKEDWAIYRQALRDVTAQSDPFNIVWPTPPGG